MRPSLDETCPAFTVAVDEIAARYQQRSAPRLERTTLRVPHVEAHARALDASVDVLGWAIDALANEEHSVEIAVHDSFDDEDNAIAISLRDCQIVSDFWSL